MCDDLTEADNARYLAEKELRMGRRDLARLGVGAAALAVLPGCEPAKSPDGPSGSAAPSASDAPSDAPSASASAAASGATTSRRVSIAMPGGNTADGFFVAPQGGKHPGVLVWPDIAGLRPAYETMATRLAGDGYAVLVVNQYWRSAPAPVLASFAEWRTDAGKAKLKPMIEAITAEAVAADGAAFVAFLDAQPEVDTKRKIGTSGYCMGGPFAIRTAGAAPARVGAVASFHGANLVTDKPDSPHLLLAKTSASYLIAIAQNDDEKQADAKTVLKEAAGAAKRPAEIEVYPAQHGFCTIDSPVYDKAQAEKAWARMLATFGAL